MRLQKFILDNMPPPILEHSISSEALLEWDMGFLSDADERRKLLAHMMRDHRFGISPSSRFHEKSTKTTWVPTATLSFASRSGV